MMNTLACDVIRDLLPSYIDGCCSETTRAYVEAHLQTCSDCEKHLRLLRDTEFSATMLEQRAFDGYKKVKRHITHEAVSAVLLAVILVLSALAGIWLLSHGGGMRTVRVYYLLLAGCLLGTIYFARTHQPEVSMQWPDKGMTALSVGVTIVVTGLIAYCLHTLDTGRIPLGLAAEQCGGFFRIVLRVAALLQILLYVLLLWRMVRRRVNTGGAMCLCLTGASMILIYRTHFASMDLDIGTVSMLPVWMKNAAIALCLGLFAGLLARLLVRGQDRR